MLYKYCTYPVEVSSAALGVDYAMKLDVEEERGGGVKCLKVAGSNNISFHGYWTKLIGKGLTFTK